MGGAEGGVPVMNGTAGAHAAEDYQQWMESKVAQGKASPQFPRHGGDVYSNTLPVRKAAPAKSKATLSKDTLATLTHPLVPAHRGQQGAHPLREDHQPPAAC